APWDLIKERVLIYWRRGHNDQVITSRLQNFINTEKYGLQFARLLFRWLFIPWLQRKINYYIGLVNNKRKRKDKNKILPHGVPEDIFWEPEQYRACDFKVMVTAFCVHSDIYAPLGDPVFQLVLPDFDCLVKTLYVSMGHPEVDMGSVWDIFCGL
ncbi:hypothetical protein P691DRAFT_637646, partial [Macrolepiota fuliginosa MF-IS2]